MNKSNAVASEINKPDCLILKSSYFPQLTRQQYRDTLDLLVGLKIITSTSTNKGTEIRLLPNDFILLCDQKQQPQPQQQLPEQKPIRKRVKKEVVIEQHPQEQQIEKPQELQDQQTEQAPEIKETLPNTTPELFDVIKPLTDNEKALLIGMGSFEQITKIAYIKKGIPTHMLNSLTHNDQTIYLEALKKYMLKQQLYFDDICFEINVEPDVLKAEFISYLTGKLFQNKQYERGANAIKNIFRRHARKTYVPDQVYEKAKSDQLYPRFVKIYFDYHTETKNAPPPTFTAVEGKSIKTLINYFVKKENGDKEKAVETFRVMFENWGKLTKPYFRQTSNINIIALNIGDIEADFNREKNGKETPANSKGKGATKGKGTSDDRLADFKAEIRRELLEDRDS